MMAPSNPNGTALITMDRPERMNAMAFEQVIPLHAAIEEVAHDNETGVVVLTGTGKGFCSGADTQHSAPPPNIDGLTLTRIASRSMSILADLVPAMRRTPQPVIAAINGAAIGGGMCLTLGADIRLVAPDARLSVRELHWGLIPDMSITRTLARLTRLDVAKELTYTGRDIDAREA